MRLADMGNGPEIFCCQWVPYPTAGNDTSCDICGSVFTLRAEPGSPELPELPAPNFYAADGPAYADIPPTPHHPECGCHVCGSVTCECAQCENNRITSADAAIAFVMQAALWSPDFDAYATGQIDASQITCVLCLSCPCACPEFGTPEYFALIDKRHGRQS